MIADPALDLFVRWTQTRGGLAETDDAATLLLLPEEVQRELDLPEEVAVTADPDVAREDGATLVIAGHPLVTAVADRVLQTGDVGRTFLRWPDQTLPSMELLVERARERFGVEHGRIEPGGHPVRSYVPVLRLGALVTYTLSLDDRFQEREEVWLDAHVSLPLRADVVEALLKEEAAPELAQRHPELPADLERAVIDADELIRSRAAGRLGTLAGHSREALELERARAHAYYDAVAESIDRRRATASAERVALLDAQAEATQVERVRRLAEIEETFHPELHVRPFRAHVVMAPAMRVPMVVRRGARAHDFSFVWVLAADDFVDARCPSCRAPEPLHAGRERLGCRACLAPAPEANGASPAAAPRADGNGARPAATPGGEEETATRAPPARGHRTARRPTPPIRAAAVAEQVRVARAREDRVRREGSKLAVRLMETATTGQRWPKKMLDRDSPAKVLSHLFGAEAPLVAMCLADDDLPVSMGCSTARPHRMQLETTTGSVHTVRGEYPFTLRWRLEAGSAVLCEVLPFEDVSDARLPALSGRGRRLRLTTGVPPPRAALDDVGALLWTDALPEAGLPLVARCLAVWWRVRSDLRDLDCPPPVIASAVLESVADVARVKSVRGLIPDLADGQEVREAVGLIRAALSPDRGW